MRYIIIKNIDDTGRDILLCHTELDECDVWLTLMNQKHTFDEVTEIQEPPYPIPDGTTLRWFTPRGEYEVHRNIAQLSPELAPLYPEWDELHKKGKRR